MLRANTERICRVAKGEKDRLPRKGNPKLGLVGLCLPPKWNAGGCANRLCYGLCQAERLLEKFFCSLWVVFAYQLGCRGEKG